MNNDGLMNELFLALQKFNEGALQGYLDITKEVDNATSKVEIIIAWLSPDKTYEASHIRLDENQIDENWAEIMSLLKVYHDNCCITYCHSIRNPLK